MIEVVVLMLCLIPVTELVAMDPPGPPPEPPESEAVAKDLSGLRIPSSVAWLEGQDDYPLVSRRLMRLDPGDSAARVILEPLLYSFDAADHQTALWLGDALIANGPVTRSRPAPNVSLPIHHVASDGEITTAREVTPPYLRPSPDGRGIVTFSITQLGFLRFVDGESRFEVILDGEQLGHSLLGDATWTAEGDALLVSVDARRDSMPSGLWRMGYRWSETDGPVFSEPVRVSTKVGSLTRCLEDGSVFSTRRVLGEKYTPHQIVRSWPGTGEKSEILVRDLHWGQAIAFRPRGASGSEGDGTLEFAYVRFEDGAIVLRSVTSANPNAEDRVLWSGPRPVENLEWSPDGAWIAFGTRDQERAEWVYAIEVESGEATVLGRGMRPVWGPETAR